jgi:phytoene dehydrogenase-like protein
VRLADGEEIRSLLVVSNADPKRTFTTMFRPGDLDDETLKRVKRMKTNAGSLKVLAAISELPDLSRYLGNGYDRESISGFKILPSVEQYQQSWDDAAAGLPTRYPLMGGHVPTLFDRSLVRGEGHVFSAWVTWATPHLKEGTWDDVRKQVGDRIIDVMTEYAPNFRDSLLHWWLDTPLDIETRVGMTDGNIRHLDMIPSQLLSQRQPYRTSVKSFYMCGAGTHPMGEVTGAPGHNAAHAILKDLQRVVV